MTHETEEKLDTIHHVAIEVNNVTDSLKRYTSKFKSTVSYKDNTWALLTSLAFILVLFGCVVLHELGHALAARMYGIPTRDITLLPIGGVARLERMPRMPSQELVVALAGSAVNVVIAGILFLMLAPATSVANLLSASAQGASFLQRLMFVNIALVIFNMLPAFPMDGGRVLRALLATMMDYVKATWVAAIVGQVCAVGFGLLGFYNPMLLLIAVFIFFGAATEANQVAMRERLGSYKVRDGMLPNFRAISANAPLRESVLDLLETPQRDFPVIDNGQFVGMLHVDDAVDALENRRANTVREVTKTGVNPVNEDEPLTKTFEKTDKSSTHATCDSRWRTHGAARLSSSVRLVKGSFAFEDPRLPCQASRFATCTGV